MVRRLARVAIAALSSSAPLTAAVLVSSDFNASTDWATTSVALVNVPAGSNTDVGNRSNVGTIDVQTNGGQATTAEFPPFVRTRALSLTADFSGVTATSWSATLRSPILPLATTNNEANLGRLNVSFDLLVNRNHPIVFRIESFSNGSDTPTGSREKTLVAPVAGSFYRHSVDLSDMVAGAPAFFPTGSSGTRVRFSFRIAGSSSGSTVTGWPKLTDSILRVDNLCYTSPSIYANRNGAGTQSGSSPANAKPLQAAVDAAVPGDVICLLTDSGPYNISGRLGNGLAVSRAGTPSRWITIRADAGATPVLTSSAFNVIDVMANARYIDIRDLVIEGNYSPSQLSAATTDGVKFNKSDFPFDPEYTIFRNDPFSRPNNIEFGNPIYNTSGITVDSRWWDLGGSRRAATITEAAHHIRIADNIVRRMPGGGIIAIKADYLYIENNEVSDTSHLTRYATSGISTLNSWPFDNDTLHKTFILRNEVYDNRCDVRWTRYFDDSTAPITPSITAKFSDGNGIIADSNNNANVPWPAYTGRTIIQNNLAYRNGGSGIQSFASTNVDAVNNTVYDNGVPNLAPSTVLNLTYATTSGTQTVNAARAQRFTLSSSGANAGADSLGYGQIRLNALQGGRYVNNILFTRSGNPAIEIISTNSLVIANNLFGGAGGVAPTIPGSPQVTTNSNNDNTTASADAVFVTPGTTPANLQLESNSVARNQGSSAYPSITPLNDITGAINRPAGGVYDIGAYERP